MRDVVENVVTTAGDLHERQRLDLFCVRAECADGCERRQARASTLTGRSHPNHCAGPSRRQNRGRRALAAAIPSRAGGCTFAPDPQLNALEAGALFWRPEHLADVVCLVPERGPEPRASRIVFDPWSWNATTRFAHAADGIHILLMQARGDVTRLWLPRRRALPRIGSRLAFHIHPDGYARERMEAAIRFWRSVSGPSVSSTPPLPARWPQRNQVRMTAMLVAHDLSRAPVRPARPGTRGAGRDARPGLGVELRAQRSAPPACGRACPHRRRLPRAPAAAQAAGSLVAPLNSDPEPPAANL